MTAFQVRRLPMSAGERGFPGTAAPAGGCEAAIVSRRDEAGLMVRRGGVGEPARLAAGCLAQPEVGDLVLVAEAAGALWVLSLLECAATRPLELRAPGAMVIAAGEDLSLTGRNVRIGAEQGIDFKSQDLAVEAARARVLVAELFHAGRQLVAHVGQLRHIGALAETMVTQVVLRAKQSFRAIEGGDVLRSADIDHHATGNYSLQAESAFITAETIVKVDAEQIHMG